MAEEERKKRGFLTLQEAAELLGITRQRMRVVAQQNKLPVYGQAADRRVKLFRRSDVERLLQPRRIDEGKAAAA